LKVGKLENYLLRLYKAGAINHNRQAVLLLGPPGVGKSLTCWSLARRLAKLTGKEFVDYNDDEAPKILEAPERYFVFVDFRLPECEPSDLMGIPEKVNGAVRFAPLLWARCLSKAAGLLLLDELTNVQRPDVISASYKLIFDRRAGFTKFHEDVLIVCCGNRPEHSAVANLPPTPLLDRLLVIDVSEPSVDEWADWMNTTYGDEWDKRCYAFNKRFEKDGYLIQVPRQTETLDPYPTPRSWTSLSTLMAKGIHDRDTIRGLIGYEVGTKLDAFLKVDVDINQLLMEPRAFHELEFDAKYMVAVMLGSWISQHIKNPARAFGLIDEMSSEKREFLVLTCMAMNRRKLVSFLRALFAYNVAYRDVLSEIAIGIKEEIAA